jgi:hypothetical protein
MLQLSDLRSRGPRFNSHQSYCTKPDTTLLRAHLESSQENVGRYVKINKKIKSKKGNLRKIITTFLLKKYYTAIGS